MGKLISTSQLAHLLSVSRVAVFKKIHKGEIKARKVGRNFIINMKDLPSKILIRTSGRTTRWHVL